MQEKSNGIEKSPQGQGSSVGEQVQEQPISHLADGTPIDRSAALVAALMRAGTLVLTSEEQFRLTAPFADCDVQQRDLKYRTEAYLPHILISRRLVSVLGAGQWCLVRLKEWYDPDSSTVYGSYALVVRGVWIGDTVAGWPYNRDNKLMDYADALESCRGVALRRIAAKSLGCGDQVWDRAPGQAPAKPPENGKPPANFPSRPISQVSPERLKSLIGIGLAKASWGIDELGDWFESLLPVERVALAGHKDSWKRTAYAADAVREQAEASGESVG